MTSTNFYQKKLYEQDHTELVKTIGNLETAIWDTKDSVAYRSWDKATEKIFGKNGYATYWQEASADDIRKLIPVGKEILKNIPT